MENFTSALKANFMVFLIFLTVYVSNAQMPLHKDVLAEIKKGTAPVPNFITSPSSARKKGIDMPWRTMLQKTHGIKLEKRNLSKMGVLSTNYKVLVILVKFTDNASSVPSSSFDQLVFGSTGNTLRNYYNSVSKNSFDIITLNLPSSTGWKQMPQSYSYYVNGQCGMGDTIPPYSYPNNCQKLAEDAVDAVDNIVDFSQYDNDGDGYVDALMFIHSGPGAEFTYDENDIWSHSWQMSEPKLHDNVYTYAYTIQPEYWENPGDMTCGVFAHEFAHMAFELPDLYDRDRDYSSHGLGDWSLMAAGSWNGPQGLGGSPAFPDAWSRMQMGFADVMNVTTNKLNQSIESVQNSSTIYRLWKYGLGGSEYFLVENRQQSGYDTYLPGNGLLIYHIDDAVPDNDHEWYPGHYNDGHYKVALEQADNRFDLELGVWYHIGDAGDPFPGDFDKHEFAVWTEPNSMDYSFHDTYVDILNISNSSSVMTADLKVGGIQIVVDQKLSDNVTRIGTVGRWNSSSFNPRINPGSTIQVKEYETETFQGDQALYSGQKYNNWNGDKTDVKNHHEFSLHGYSGIISNFEPTYMGVTIRNSLEGYTSLEGGAVSFKDPWFIDYPDPSYGYQLRNRGTSAVFMSRPSPFIPNTNLFEYGRKYNGVFLDENPDPNDPNIPYYSVCASATQDIYLSQTGKTHRFYFQNWGASPSSDADFETASSNVTKLSLKIMVLPFRQT
jgi:immune inhibitor A